MSNLNHRFSFKLSRSTHSLFGVLFILLAIPATVYLAVTVRQYQTPAATTSFSDDFTLSTLQNGWVWQNPSTNSSFSLVNGSLGLTAAHGDDQWVGVDRSSRVLRTERSAPWSIETKVVGNSGTTFGQNFAGLVIFKDSQNWFLWGQLGNASLEGSGLIANIFTNTVAVMSTNFNYLRIRHAGTKYFFDASSDGKNWTNANSFDDTSGALNGARYGFMAKDWSGGSGPSYTAAFDYFYEYGQDLLPSALAAATSTVQIAKEIGLGSLNNTSSVDVCGADLGSMFDWNGLTYNVFGDSSKCPVDPANLDRSSTLAVSSDTTLSNGITFNSWVTSAGRAKELFPEDPGTITAIPTYGVSVGSSAYLFYMQVTNWNPWTCNYSSIATSTDAGQNWVKKNGTIVWGPGNFNQVAIYKQDPYLYIWGIPCGRSGSVKLMRVAQTSVLDKTQYQYFSGYDSLNNPVWASNNESLAVTVAGGPAGELSVIFNPWLGRYLMTYLEDYSGKIVARESLNPWGPWSSPVTITASATYPALYGSYMKTGFWENNGESVYFRMSQFFPVYATFWMKTTLVKEIPPAVKLGDVNGDGLVNSADLAILLSTWGSATDLRADVNTDGRVNSADLAILLSRWGS